MNAELRWMQNPMKTAWNKKKEEQLLNQSIYKEVREFHKNFEEYTVTPLCKMTELAEYLEVGEIYVKDESQRFGLNAFKVLGASYAVGKSLAKKLKRPIGEVPLNALQKEEIKKQLGEMLFAATTDGNHGRGVAWTAKRLGFPATIYMPKGTTENRLQHILKLGAHAEITEYNYDDTVRWMAEEGEKKGWEIIQDTAWERYEDVPTWIMQGYSTVAGEIIEELRDTKPTHIFLQAGVGAFAAVMTGVFLQEYSQQPPKIIIVEAQKADCFYQSIEKGTVTPVTGELNTIMAGLACGEPNPLAWEILKEYTDVFISAPDWMTARGMRILGNPLAKDPRVISGESGAVTTGVLSVIAQQENYKELKEILGLQEDSVVVLVSTEGDTDAEVYRDIVWDGSHPSQNEK